MKILVLGYIVKGPLAGMSLHYMQFVLGLKKLGHKVLFYEDSDDGYPSCYNPETLEMSYNPLVGLNYIRQLFNAYDLKDNWTYYDSLTGKWHGISKLDSLSFMRTADIVINISGVNPLREWWAKIPCRIFIDTDCIFTQIKMLKQPHFFDYVKDHTCHFSLGENIGQADCKVPTASVDWKTTRQPVYLDIWKEGPLKPNGSWTTIMAWDSHRTEEYNGIKFGMKSASFVDYFTLPQILPNEVFEMGIQCDFTIAKQLTNTGWIVIDPRTPTKTVKDYQGFIQYSRGEWSVAKHGFAFSRNGYLSERSLNYMASGKPVVIQDTGFSKYYQTGKGLFAFSSLEEAREGINRINRDYAFHCSKARELVKEYADSTKVLSKLINESV